MRLRRERRACSILTALVLLLTTTPCLAGVELSGADGVVTDLESPAQRLITLSPHLTELVFSAGAGAQLIATVDFSEFPAEARNIARIGDAFRLDLERIVSFKPDLVIAWHSGNPRQAVERLRSLDIPIWSVEIRHPEEIADVIESIGRASGTESTAVLAAGALRDQLQRISGTWSQRDPVDYFYQVDESPLYTINGQHLISRGLTLCGGSNIFAQEPGLATQVSRESVIVANPRALIAPVLPNTPDPLAHWREWPRMQAVKAEGLIRLPADDICRATARFLNAVETACLLLDDLRTQRENNSE